MASPVEDGTEERSRNTGVDAPPEGTGMGSGRPAGAVESWEEGDEEDDRKRSGALADGFARI